MSCIPVYCSKDDRYKTPFGAVASGGCVSFSLHPPRNAGYSYAVLHARFEGLDDQMCTVNLPWTDCVLGQDVFSGTLKVGDYVGLIWYSFSLSGLDGRSETIAEHQLTVYDDSESVPNWFGEGVSYQIFPDRFCRSRVPDATGLVGGRTVHASWDEEPEYRPDERGEIRNRDFFGGDLNAVIEKLDYLSSLGVETIYFCPIFEAAENHRYGTADYLSIDPMLGTEADFVRLCNEAHRRGMRILLDGVFNHIGSVSRYFNSDGFYPDVGAAQSEDSIYHPWFRFQNWPHEYDSWWGIKTLPGVEENNPDYRRFIYDGEQSVVRRWLRAGADGWRLDVADELPDDFIAGIHAAARMEKPDSVIIGEVWEDGSSKIAYDVRRKHIMGRHCDGLMNYPLRNAILGYLFGGDAADFVQNMEAIRENYPPFAFYSGMNLLGTHDTVRILTLFGAGGEHRESDREWRANFRLSAEQYEAGREKLKTAAALLYAFPGSPMIYYGDEAGLEGFEDPFNRRTFPWGKEDGVLLAWFQALGKLRKTCRALRRGDIRYLAGTGALLAFTRNAEGESILAAFNAGENSETLVLAPMPQMPQCLLGAGEWELTEQSANLTLPPCSGVFYRL